MAIQKIRTLAEMATPTGVPNAKGKSNQCYENARKECVTRPGSHYIIGVLKYIPKGDRSKTIHSVKHAWCEDKGVVYDPSPILSDWSQYDPWAECSFDKKSLDAFPTGESVTKVFPAAKQSVWFGSQDWKKVPKVVRDKL